MRFLDEESARENQDVRPQQGLDLVENARVPRQFRGPGHEKVGHRSPFHVRMRVDAGAQPCLVALYTLPADLQLFLVEKRKRGQKSVVPPLRDVLR